MGKKSFKSDSVLLKEIDSFISICKKELQQNLRSIILFGSVARKEYTEFSDFDFCVIVKRNITEKKRLLIMQQFPKNCDVIVRLEKDIPHYLKNLNALDLDIFAEGVVIYGLDVLAKNGQVFDEVKKKYNLIHHTDYGKGVWEIGAVS